MSVCMHIFFWGGGGGVLEKKPEYHSPVLLDDYSYTKDAALDFWYESYTILY